MSGKDERKNNSLFMYLGALGLFLLTKGKGLLTLLKASKFTYPIISMLASIWAYALLFPFGFAVGLVVMILIHEMGHVIAAKQKGLPVSAPLFIPFVGALITMKKHPRDAVTEAYMAMGGPVFGTLGALVAFVLGMAWDSDLLIVIANVGFLINLINLLPIHPLDGGRISTAVTRWLWLVGLIGGLVVIIYLRSFIFFFIWAMFAWEMYNKYVVGPRERGKRFHVTSQIAVPVEYLIANGHVIPEQHHRRALQCRTYSNLDDRQQMVDIIWVAAGLNETIRLPRQAIVHGVQLTRVDHTPPIQPTELLLHCDIEFEWYEPSEDKYYDVPLATRWNFGVAYVGLAIFLGYMLYVISNLNINV